LTWGGSCVILCLCHRRRSSVRWNGLNSYFIWAALDSSKIGLRWCRVGILPD